MYDPKPDQILPENPRPGMFYRRTKSGSVTVAQIAMVAAGNAAKMGQSISTANMVKKIAYSPWNRAHFSYSRKRYENYGFDGPQYDPVGGVWPVIWVPTVDGAEPEQVFDPAPSAPPSIAAPGFATKSPSGAVTSPGFSSGTLPSRGGTGSGTLPGSGDDSGAPLEAGLAPKSAKGWIIAGIVVVVGLVAGIAMTRRGKKKGK